MRESRLNIAKNDIIKLFNNRSQRVFTPNDMDAILAENREFWRLAKRTTTNQFIDYITKSSSLKQIVIPFPYADIERYIWEDASDFEIIQSLKPNSYFSHYTAMFLNKLTVQIPKAVYLNFEQPPKFQRDTQLSQGRIDYAFSKACRVTHNTSNFNGRKIYIINGKNTDKLGVIEFGGDKGEKLKVTSVERTLIDITVRPIYSGGVHQVLEAFRLAAENVSINEIAAFLKSLKFTYPFHQAIGFYLEKAANYRESQIALMEQFEIKYNFYLTHQMKDTEYSKKWKLFYPKGL